MLRNPARSAVTLGAVSLIAALLAVFDATRTSASAAQRTADLLSDVSREVGLDFWHFNGATGAHFFPEIAGSGGALFDYDGDGDLDVHVVQGQSLDPGRGVARAVVPVPAGWRPGNRLFRNELVPSGRLTFTDVTDTAGVGHEGVGMGVATGDYDNDGHVDLFVTNFGENVLYRNHGDGTFEDVTATAGVTTGGWSTSAAWLDYDRDGLLDLVVVRYVDFNVTANLPCHTAAGQPDYCGPQVYGPTTTRLLRNRGGGRFEDVSVAAGLEAVPGPGLGVLTGRFDDDGWMDFAVANDGAANRLWLNRERHGRRVFEESALMRGIAFASDGQARAGMGVAAGNLDGDGREDIAVTNLRTEGFTLFRQEAPGLFIDATVWTRLLPASLPHTGFGVGWFDLENRGIDDLFAANGAVLIIAGQQGEPFPYRERNLLLRNLGGRRGFENVTAKAGPALALVEVSRAAAFGDVDNDGGVDVLVTNSNGPLRLLRNTAMGRGHWLLVALEGREANRDGYGSVVSVTRSDGVQRQRTARGDGSYLAANDPRLHFGLGGAAGPAVVDVGWLGGTCERWVVDEVDRVVTVRQGEGGPCV